MDQDRQFGMVLHARTSSGLHSHGTMLRIRNLQLLSDGRSLVDTVGMWRFRVVSVGVLDGYCVGEVERLDDNSLEEEAELEQAAVNADPPEPSTATYISILQAFIETIQSNAPPMQVRRMHQAFGPVPLEATALTFYAAQLLPQPDSVKAVLLEVRPLSLPRSRTQMNSPRQRAKTVVSWIAEMRQQNGSRCPIM